MGSTKTYSRREILKLTGAAFAGTASARVTEAAPKPPAPPRKDAPPPRAPVALPAGPHLFLDDYLVADAKNLKRTVHPPVREPQPVVTGKEDGNFQPYVSVLRDPETKRFRMWYNVAAGAGQSRLGYMESEDGLHWLRPHRVLSDPLKIVYGASVLDDGPQFPEKDRRYKLAGWNGGMWVAFSPDGLAWTPAAPRPVLPGVSDIVSLARDPARNRYLATFKMDSASSDGFKGKTQNAPENYRRLVGQSVSRDCVKWDPPSRIVVPDARDEGITEFYSIGGVIARGGLLIGLLKVLRDDLPAEPGGPVNGIGYTVLAWSRDGERWERDREPFLDRSSEPKSWDRAMTWGDCQLPVGDELYLYYGGYARGHKVEPLTERQIGLARIGRDRYVSRDAGALQGMLKLPPTLLDAAVMTLNAKVDGEARARFRDISGKPLPGFDWQDCAPIRGDSLAHPVRWKRPLATLRGKPVRLEITARAAQLYGFDLTA
jgi:hypothetical protein